MLETSDDTFMNQEELDEKIERSMKQIKSGDCFSKNENETMEQYIERLLK